MFKIIQVQFYYWESATANLLSLVQVATDLSRFLCYTHFMFKLFSMAYAIVARMYSILYLAIDSCYPKQAD